MATLADSFLDDLDELDDDDDDNETESYQIKSESKAGDDSDDEEEDEMDEGETDLNKALVKMVASKKASNIGLLRSSNRYTKHLADIAAVYDKGLDLNSGIKETDPEYQLILASNKIIQEIDEEIIGTQRYVTEIYARKFPELESLINNKIDYILTVKRIGNEMDMTMVELSDLLPSSTVMIVSVTGSTTSGQPLSSEDLTECLKACEEVMGLDSDKNTVLRFIESRMSRIAPNLSHLIGKTMLLQRTACADINYFTGTSSYVKRIHIMKCTNIYYSNHNPKQI
jgi:U4/U6 small nuclear ribonucleoprotein PRP31